MKAVFYYSDGQEVRKGDKVWVGCTEERSVMYVGEIVVPGTPLAEGLSIKDAPVFLLCTEDGRLVSEEVSTEDEALELIARASH
jgi:hypothetical protein